MNLFKGCKQVITCSVSQSEGKILIQLRENFHLPPPFHSSQALSGSNDAYPNWGGPSAVLSPLIQMLITSSKTLTEINVLPGHPMV